MNRPYKIDPAVNGREIIRWYQDFMTNPASRARQIAASNLFFSSHSQATSPNPRYNHSQVTSPSPWGHAWPRPVPAPRSEVRASCSISLINHPSLQVMVMQMPRKDPDFQVKHLDTAAINYSVKDVTCSLHLLVFVYLIQPSGLTVDMGGCGL